MKVRDGQVDIRFGGYAAADQLLFASWPTHFVSIATPGSPHPRPPGWFDGHTLQMSFRDTRNPLKADAPGVMEIRSLVHFAAAVPTGSRVLIACPGGYSRSAAVAVVLAVILGANPADAIRQMRLDHGQATPNPVLIRSADTQLNLDGDLIVAWKDWLCDMGLNESNFAPLKPRNRR